MLEVAAASTGANPKASHSYFHLMRASVLCCALHVHSKQACRDHVCSDLCKMDTRMLSVGCKVQRSIARFPYGDRRKASLKPGSSSRCSSEIWHLSPNSFCTASSNPGPWLEHRAHHRDLESSSVRSTSSIESTLCTNQKALAASETEAASAAAAAVVQKRVACGVVASRRSHLRGF